MWLVNTGWSGGAYGCGSRMKLGLTRAMVRAALAGKLDNAPVKTDPVFGLNVPQGIDGVPAEVLDARGEPHDDVHVRRLHAGRSPSRRMEVGLAHQVADGGHVGIADSLMRDIERNHEVVAAPKVHKATQPLHHYSCQ